MSSTWPWHRKALLPSSLCGTGKGLGEIEAGGPQHGTAQASRPEHHRDKEPGLGRPPCSRSSGSAELLPLCRCQARVRPRDTIEGSQQREEQRRCLGERRPGLLWRPREGRNRDQLGAHFSRATQSLQTQTKPEAGKLGTERGWIRGEASPGGQLMDSTEERFHPSSKVSTEAKALETSGYCNTAHVMTLMIKYALKHKSSSIKCHLNF